MKSNELRPWRAVLHPLWVIGLFVLVINDHVMKTSEHAGWLTGKVSDFAGLLIAPVLLATLLQVRTKRGVWLSALATGCVFAAINVSYTAAHYWDRLASVIYPYYTTVDPSDLVALISIPLGVVAFLPLMERDGRTHSTQRLLQIALVVAGGLASVATSPPPCEGDECGCDDCWWEPAMQSRYSIVNNSNEMHVLRIRLPRESVVFGCGDIQESPSDFFQDESFGPASRWMIQSGQQIPIDAMNASFQGRRGGDFATGCGVAWIQSDTLPDVLVVMNADAEMRIFDMDGEVDTDNAPNTLVIEGEYDGVAAEDMKPYRFRNACGTRADWCTVADQQELAEVPEGARYRWEANGDLVVQRRSSLPIPEAVPSHCEMPDESAALYWDNDLLGSHVIEAAQVGEDGCVRLELSGRERPSWICGPAVVSDALNPNNGFLRANFVYENTQGSGFRGGWDSLVIDVSRFDYEGRDASGQRLQLIRGYEMPTGFQLDATPREGCSPVFESCGQASMPVDLRIGNEPVAMGALTQLSNRATEQKAVVVRAVYMPVVDAQCESTGGTLPPMQIDNPTYFEAVLIGG